MVREGTLDGAKGPERHPSINSSLPFIQPAVHIIAFLVKHPSADISDEIDAIRLVRTAFVLT